MQGASFQDCEFIHCDLSNLSAGESFFRRVLIRDSKLVGADLSLSSLQHITLSCCEARYLNLSQSRIREACFTGCRLDESAFSQTALKGVVFDQCQLNRADFFETPLKGIDLSGCEIAGIQLSGKELAGCMVSPLQAMALAQLLGLIVKEDW